MVIIVKLTKTFFFCLFTMQRIKLNRTHPCCEATKERVEIEYLGMYF